MMLAETLATTFGEFASELEKEVGVLKCISNIRKMDEQKQGRDLRDLELSVGKMETSFSALEKMLDQELLGIEKARVLQNKAQHQSEEMAGLEIPAALQLREVGGEIHAEEFEELGKTTKGRLQLHQLNSALKDLRQLFEARAKNMQIPRKKMTRVQQADLDNYILMRCDEHVDSKNKETTFLTENEIRTSAVFTGGDATLKTIIQSLRALKRLKVVRVGKDSTFILF